MDEPVAGERIFTGSEHHRFQIEQPEGFIN